MGAGGKEAHSQGPEGLRVDLPLRLRAARERRGLLADLVPTVNTELFSMALNEFAKEVGAGKDKHILLVVDKAGWHTGKEVEVPEGIHLVSSCPPARRSSSRRRGYGP